MNALSEIFPVVLLASRDAAVLALLIAAVLVLAGRRTAPAWRHGLWLLVVVRLLMPDLPDSALSWRNWFVPDPVEDVVADSKASFPAGADLVKPFEFPADLLDKTVTELGAAGLDGNTGYRWTLMEFLACVWVAGSLVYLSMMFVGVIRFQRLIGRFASRDQKLRQKLQTELDLLSAEHGIRRAPVVVLTDAVDAPALTGWIRPRILIPSGAVTGLSDRQIRLVLLHELGHQRRRDVAINWILCFVQAVHWFNPIVWWAFRRIRIEAERATDEWVLLRDRAGRPADYGETLIRLLESVAGQERRFPGVVGVLESRQTLRSRIEAIRRFRGRRKRWLGAVSIMLLLGLSAIGLTQPPIAEPATPTKPSSDVAREDSPSEPDDGTSEIHLVAKLWRMTEGNNEELIASPETVTVPGEWLIFESRSEIRYPTAYDPPRLPESLAVKAKGGGTLDETGEARSKWGTHPADIVIPPFPTEFGKESVGWTLKARPEWDEAGKLRIAGVLEQRILKGFTNRGLAITAETNGGVFGRTKSRTVAENRQLRPVFLERRQELIFESGKGGWVSKVVSDTGMPDAGGEEIVEGFAEGICEREMPRLRVEMTGKAVETETNEAGKEAVGERQIYVTTRFVEIPEELRETGNTGEIQNGAGFGYGAGKAFVTVHALFSDPQFQVVIRYLSQIKGADILSAPSIMLRDGEPGQVEVIREFVYPTKFNQPFFPNTASEDSNANAKGFPVSPTTPTAFESYETGVLLGLSAREVEGGMIELELAPRVSEFRDFLDFGAAIHEASEKEIMRLRLSDNRIEQPVFDVRSSRSKVRVPRGHTVLVGGLVSERKLQIEEAVPLLGLVTESRTEVKRRFLYIFVTPQVFDPRGYPVP